MPPEDHNLDLRAPRTVLEIVTTTLTLYGRYWLLLLPLAAIVVVPYEVVVILIARTANVSSSANIAEGRLVGLEGAQLLIVQPLLAALQVHALAMLGGGERPRFRAIFRRSVSVLLTVIAVEIIAAILTGVGFVLFIIPGIYLLMRFAVVAQVAAIERTNWPTSLRTGWEITRGNWWRIFFVLLIGGLINGILSEIAGAIVSPGVNVGAVVVALIFSLLTLTFSALLSAVLYFDLRARAGY